MKPFHCLDYGSWKWFADICFDISEKKDLLKLEGMQTEQAVHICNNCFISGFLDDYVQR